MKIRRIGLAAFALAVALGTAPASGDIVLDFSDVPPGPIIGHDGEEGKGDGPIGEGRSRAWRGARE